MKKLFTLAFVFLGFYAYSQTLKPIARMVAEAGQDGQSGARVALFTAAGDNLNVQAPSIGKALESGLVLNWDAAGVAALRKQAQGLSTVTLPFLNGSSIRLDLVPAKNFSDAFEVHVASAAGASVAVDKGVHYWGVIHDDPESFVSLSVFENEVMGLISTREGTFTLGAIPNEPAKKHIFYRDADLKMPVPPTCETDEVIHQIGDGIVTGSRAAGPDNCVRMHIQTDYTLFQNKGSVANVVTYMTGVFSQVSALYTNETVNVVLHDLLVWDVTDPYTGPSASNYLTQFRNYLNGTFNGDLAHLVGIHNLGGVAYLDVLCNGYYSVGYSSINATYNNVPTYSWTVEVLTHEIGHNLGSPHTHACSWNGNNTAIDGCGPTAGYSEGCTAALPTNGGTIMSYCHLVSGVGINFNNGFGPQPGDRIRTEVYNAACLNACGGGGGGCSYTTINSQNFESNWGIWTDGGTDCARVNNSTYANSVPYSIQLRDNTNTSVTTTSNQNWTAYDEITVTFSYISVSFENGEDFWVQISTNGGSTYTTKGDFNAGTEFTNGVRKTGTVVIPGPFTATTRLRFRADASADDDQVYIDDVVITGCLQQFAAPSEDRNQAAFDVEKQGTPGISSLSSSPNPARDQYNLQFIAEADLAAELLVYDLSGRVVFRQEISANAGENRYTISVGNWERGMYLVHLRAGEDSFTEKMLLVK